MELLQIAKMRYGHADCGGNADKHEGDAEVNSGLMHSNGFRRFGLLTHASEESDHAQAEAAHGECGPDPRERCSIECDACAEGRQLCAAFGLRDAWIGLWICTHGYTGIVLLMPCCYRGSLEQTKCGEREMER